MPGKTLGDRILELEKNVAALEERVAQLIRDRERSDRITCEDHSRRWTLLVAVAGAVIGSVVTFLLQQFAAIRFPLSK